MFAVHRIFNDFGERLFLGFLLDLLRPMQKGSIMPVGVDDPNPFTAFTVLCLIVWLLFILFVEIVYLFAPLIFMAHSAAQLR